MHEAGSSTAGLLLQLGNYSLSFNLILLFYSFNLQVLPSGAMQNKAFWVIWCEERRQRSRFSSSC